MNGAAVVDRGPVSGRPGRFATAALLFSVGWSVPLLLTEAVLQGRRILRVQPN